MAIDIIGAGIGGLTTAIALKQKQLNVKIFEQAPNLSPVGAGIILASNAMQVYESLDLRESIESLGQPIHSMNITTPNLELLSSIDLTYFEKKYGVKSIAIHRGILQQLLIKTLKGQDIHLDKRLVNVTNQINGLHLKFDDDTCYSTQILIGADGIHSKVRSLLFKPGKIRRAQQMCWRGVLDFELPEQYQFELNEVWGKGCRIGFVQITPKKVYWYALKSISKPLDILTKKHLLEWFKEFHPLPRLLIELTPMQNIHTDEIRDLKPLNNWVLPNACLIGDAAHATTPNLGQGACQAIEDAYALAQSLDQHPTIAKAFLAYQQKRMKKAHLVTNSSWKIGQLAHFQNRLLTNLRNLTMRWTPRVMQRKLSEQIFELG